MIEIVLGVLIAAAALAVTWGTGTPLLAPVREWLPFFNAGGALAVAALGLILTMHGAYRVARERGGDRYAVRSLGLALIVLMLVAAFGLAAPLLAEPLALIRVGGFPLGYYMAAQGSLVALAALAFAFAARQSTIDAEEGVVEDTGTSDPSDRSV